MTVAVSASTETTSVGAEHLGKLAQTLTRLPGLGDLIRRVLGPSQESTAPRDPLEDAIRLCLADRWTEAAEALRALATPSCTAAPIWRALGVAHGRVGDWRRAQSALERAVFLERDPGTAELLQEVRSVRRWERACLRRPWDTDARAYLGVLLFGWEHGEAALAHLRVACGRGTKVVGAYTCLGVELHAQGDAVGAEEAYRTALRLQPDEEQVALLLAGLQAGRTPTSVMGAAAETDEWRRAVNG